MVLVADRNGQLCNRLFHFSYFIANAIEYNYKVIYPCFDEYAELFNVTATNQFSGVQASVTITPFRLLDRLILRYLNSSLIPKKLDLDVRSNAENDLYDLKQEKYQQTVHKKLVIAKGWLFRDEENLKKHRAKLKEIFTPLKKYSEQVQEIISALKEKFDVIVGVHIRKGDYETWQDGKFFYSDAVYSDKMKQMEQQLHNEGKSCCFFIASNELVDPEAFSPLNTAVAQRHFMVDLYSLAACDYIMGPPSTFSYWAAFYGEKPLLELNDPAADVKVDNFIYY